MDDAGGAAVVAGGAAAAVVAERVMNPLVRGVQSGDFPRTAHHAIRDAANVPS